MSQDDVLNSLDGTSQSAGSQMDGQSTNRSIFEEICKISLSIESVSSHVDQLSETVYGPPARKRSVDSYPTLWADRQDRGLDSSPHWSEEDDGEDTSSSEMIKLSEHNKSLVSAAFSTALSNMERRKIRNTFPTPDIQQTCCPRLDSIFKSSFVKSEAKSLDSELARLQAFVLDPVTLLVNMIH